MACQAKQAPKLARRSQQAASSVLPLSLRLRDSAKPHGPPCTFGIPFKRFSRVFSTPSLPQGIQGASSKSNETALCACLSEFASAIFRMETKPPGWDADPGVDARTHIEAIPNGDARRIAHLAGNAHRTRRPHSHNRELATTSDSFSSDKGMTTSFTGSFFN